MIKVVDVVGDGRCVMTCLLGAKEYDHLWRLSGPANFTNCVVNWDGRWNYKFLQNIY